MDMKWLAGNRVTDRGAWETVEVGMDGPRIAAIRVFSDPAQDLPWIAPGFIDIHVHGGGGADTMDASPEAFATMAATHARFGTTSLLLTTVTETPERIEAVLATAARYLADPAPGAQVAGVHLEGPFIHPQRCGAQRPDRILDPDPRLAARWFATGLVKMMTLAPERPSAHDVARLAVAAGVVVAAGHTTANFADMEAAAGAGFSHVTHLCNAMNPLLHREPGPIGAVVMDSHWTGDLICDGIHVAPAMMRTLLAAIGTDRLLLITDAIRAAVQPPGLYDLGGLQVEVADGACRLADGTLAGSVLTMADAVQRVQQQGGATRWEAWRMASRNPASRLGLHRKGRVEVGYDADLVMQDASGDVLATFVAGTRVYERRG